jgi:hypothetical protein
MTVRIPIQADGGAVAKVFEDIRKAIERSGQAGREFSKVDLSHPELKEHADDLRKIIAQYDELKRVWRQLGVRTRATGQGQAAPWDLDMQRMYPTAGQAGRARETLGRRLLQGTTWGAGLPPPGHPPGGVPGQAPGGGGGGPGIPGIPGLGLPGMGSLLKFTLGLAGLGGIASMAKQGVGQAQQEAIKLDPLYRMLQGTVESFGQLRDTTRDLGKGLGVAYEQSVQLGSEFARLSGQADTAGMARGTRTGIGLARGLGMEPGAGVGFMARSRLTGLYSGSGERQFAAMIAAGVRQGGMQTMPDKVMQSVDNLATTLTRSGVDAKGQIADMLAFTARMNASGNPALRGDFGQSIISRISQGMQSPGMGEAGEFFMYRALGIADPFKSKLARERGAFDRGEDGVMAIEKILRQARIDTPGSAEQRAVGMSGVFGIAGNAWMALDKLFSDARTQGIEPTQEDVQKILTEYGGNEGADTVRLMTGIHDALTKSGGVFLPALLKIQDVLVAIAGEKYTPPPMSRDTMTPKAFEEAVGVIKRDVAKKESEANARFRQGLGGKLAQGAINKASAATGVDPGILAAVMKAESSGDPFAVSSAGAMGLMQLMPPTAKRFGVHDPFNADQNMMGGAKYLAWLNKRQKGDWWETFAGYHAGEGNLDKAKSGRPSQLGAGSAAYADKLTEALGLPGRPAWAAGIGTVRIEVQHKDSAGRNTRQESHDVPLDVPASAGKAAAVIH